MDLHIFQRGFNFSQDGPGNRLVYHLQGCNLHCPWCSNPEGMTFCGGTVCSVEDIVAEVLRSRPMFFDGGGVTLTGGEAAMQPQAVKELLSALSGYGIHTALESNGTAPPAVHPLSLPQPAPSGLQALRPRRPPAGHRRHSVPLVGKSPGGPGRRCTGGCPHPCYPRLQ